jgi:hypothetical protein
MEAFIEALEQAGYTVEKNEPFREVFLVTIVKDGIRQRLNVLPPIVALDKDIELINLMHERKAQEKR